jgi:hypothetical protein
MPTPPTAGGSCPSPRSAPRPLWPGCCLWPSPSTGGGPAAAGRWGVAAASRRWRALLVGSRGRVVPCGGGAGRLGAAHRDPNGEDRLAPHARDYRRNLTIHDPNRQIRRLMLTIHLVSASAIYAGQEGLRQRREGAHGGPFACRRSGIGLGSGRTVGSAAIWRTHMGED